MSTGIQLEDPFHSGAAVDKSTLHKIEEPNQEKAESEVKVEEGSGWSNNPSIPNQFTSHPTTVKEDSRQASVFFLDDKAQLKEYNNILSKTHGALASIKIIDKKVQPPTGETPWSVYIEYVTYKFKKIIPKGENK